jgi:tRNA(Ile)-lysidine synthase
MIKGGERIIAAVSGGADSVCLLEMLSQLRNHLDISIVVAHLDHGFRPKEDTKETEFVTALAKTLGLPLAYEKAHRITNEKGGSLEEKAREMRYRFFEKVLTENHAQKVALGHNLNDQAETVLMHFLRGAGLKGLSGIPPTRDDCFIRPLIEITRDEIHAYLKQKNQSFMLDSSNFEKQYLRNKIRLELIPLLSKYQPRLIEHLGELTHRCREENQFMVEEARKRLHHLILNSSDSSIELSVAGLKNLTTPLQYRVIRLAIERIKGNLRRIGSGHVKAIMDLVHSSKPQSKINLPQNIGAKRTYEKLTISSEAENGPVSYQHYVKNPGTLTIPEINQTLSCEVLESTDALPPRASAHEALFDLSKVSWPLTVRNLKAGDRIMPLGLNGLKKVKDIFIDNKIPSEERKRIPLLCNGDDILWVCGIRTDERYKVKEETKQILRCKVEKCVI